MRFSILIPAYNAANTLDKALDSIRAQSFGDWQTLILDDGSSDDTARVAAGYGEKDPRFITVSLAHGGPGAARNRGLELARGEYVLYMDADDYWLREDLLEQLDVRLRQEPADVLMYQTLRITEAGTVLKRYGKPRFLREDQVLSLDAVYADLVRDGQTLASACNKCVCRELLVRGDVCFREDVFAEDIDWVIRLFSQTKTIRLLNLDAYAYTQHRTTSRSSHRDAANDLAEVVLYWGDRCVGENLEHRVAVAGLVAFEYGICMGSHHRLSRENRLRMRRNAHLLDFGLDRKTKLIRRFFGVLGYDLTCLAIRIYLILRRIW